MEQTDPRHQPILNRTIAVSATAALWLVAAVLALLTVFALREIYLWAMTLLFVSPESTDRFRIAGMITLGHHCVVIGLGLLVLIAIIASLDYLFNHAGEPRLNRRLLVVVAVEAAIILPVAVAFWL